MTFETFLTPDRPRSRQARRITYALSLLFHGALLVFGVAGSVWRVDELSPPAIPLFLHTLAPPPTPPTLGSRKPAPRRARSTPTLLQPRPSEAPTPPPPASAADEHPGGTGTGSRDGDPLGNGGADTDASTPILVAPNVGRGQLAIDPQADPYRVRLPPAMLSAGLSVWALVKICVRTSGEVESVTILKNAEPSVDRSLVSVLQTWRYLPYTIDGHPVRFCTTLRYMIAAR